MTTVCPRCTGKDGAHYMECVIGRLFERLMGPEYPWKAPLAPVPEREALRVRQTAEDVEFMTGRQQQQAMEAAADELLGLDEPEPEPEPEPRPDYVGEIVASHAEVAQDQFDPPAVVKAIKERHGWTYAQIGQAIGVSASAVGFWAQGSMPGRVSQRRLLELLEAEPAPRPEEPAKRKARIAAAHLPRQASDEAVAAVELFLEEQVEDAGPQEAVNVGALVDAYSQWRGHMDAPVLPTNLFVDALDRLNVGPRRKMTEAERIKLGRPSGPSLVIGKRLKGEAPIVLPEGLDADIDWPTARRAMVAAFAQDCLILGENGPTDVPFAQRSDWIVGTQLADAFNQWREENQPEWPELTQADVTSGMKAIGYNPRQSITIGGSKPGMFFGVTLRPKANWGQPRASERAAEADKEDHAKAIRTLMRQAKLAARPAPAPAPVFAAAPEPDDVPASTNNGWHKPPATGGTTTVKTVTLEDLEAENARIMAAKRRGPSTAGLRRPKQGEITNKDVRRLVNLAVDQGYIYWLDGSNHPKIQHPTDPSKRIGCAGSASDRNAHRQVARDLKKIGVVL